MPGLTRRAIRDQMSLAEKIALLTGSGLWRTTAIDRFSIPEVRVSDGPNGVRGETLLENTSTCFPVGVALASTWDTRLVEAVGAAIGREARDKDVCLVLGPTINLQRTPIGGRNFECYSEDPVLTGRLACAFVTGVQSQGVGACLKHFVANDTEFERHSIDSQVADRPLRELYLLPFEMAVSGAAPWSVMSSYNRVNGLYASSNAPLINGVLKGEWGFDGFVVSDWGAALETVGNALGGLDLEMPGPGQAWGAGLMAAVESGEVSEAVIDDKVDRILLFLERAGRLSGPGPRPERTVDRPEHRETARKAARDGMVLLKNDGVLPFDPHRIKRLAVIGPNARRGQIQGGGSSGVRAVRECHPLEGLRAALPDTLEVVHEPGCLTHKYLPLLDTALLTPDQGEGRGWTCEYFESGDFTAPAALRRTETRSNIMLFGGLPDAPELKLEAIRLSAAFTAQETGVHAFGLASAGFTTLMIDDEELVDNWDGWERGETFYSFGSTEKRGEKFLEAGRTYRLTVCFASRYAGMLTGIRIGMMPPMPSDLFERAVAAASAADAVVLVLGTNSDWETEGNDRADMSLPGGQDALAAAVLAANPNTAVVVNAGSPVDMPWNDQAPAALYSWFAGQEFGAALADLLFGTHEPNGRLPITIPRRLEDTPAYTAYPGENGVMPYAEGLFIGYRWYQERDLAPLYPFGHGLGYGLAEITAVSAPEQVRPGQCVDVEVDIRNAGGRGTVCVVQLYLNAEASRLRRPPQELKAFAKVTLAPSETARVRLTLEPRDFAYWDPATQNWAVDPGRYELRVGWSCADIQRILPLTLSE